MSTGPLSYLEAAGPAAAPLARLAWGLGGVSIAVVAIIALALAGAIWRPRPDGTGGAREVWRPANGLAWIYVGLALSTPVLAACTVWVLVVLGQVMHPATPPALTLQVTAHQWWWEARYLGRDGAATFTTANEIHIPAGTPIRVELTSPDVIHSFWVPRLAGKMDLIPGVTNVTWIEAAAPGRFQGQCAEFCGLQHANMTFFVVADSPADYAAWSARQAMPPASPATPIADEGGRIFAARCAACHTVSGTPAGGVVGPDLSHFATRATLAAGMLPNDGESLTDWIRDPQAVKPGALMPAVPMTDAARAHVVAYLQSLT